MKHKQPLNLLYVFQTPLPGDGFVSDRPLLAKYFISKFYHPEGELVDETLFKLYEQMFGHSMNYEWGIGPFDGLDELNQYAVKVTQEVGAPGVNLLSLHEYNNAVEKINDAESFKGLFQEIGLFLQNPDSVESSGALLSRFFKPKG